MRPTPPLASSSSSREATAPTDGSIGFAPPPGLRSGFLQSVLATKRPARRFWARRGVDLDTASVRHEFAVMDEQDQPAVLAGYFTQARDAARAGALVVLIHGWEGSHESAYLYSMAAALHAAGHAVFRLNLRDHGGSHGMNEGLFHSARLREVLLAVKAAQALVPSLPLFVIGFSLGGNFALRVGLHGRREGLAPLLSIGVSPSVNPHATLRGIDAGPKIVNRYFLDKWHRTMAAKDAAWPGRYDFSRHRALRNFVEITRAFVEDYTEFDSLEAYLGEYTLLPEQLMASANPLAIVTARDDSVCPPADFEGLAVQGGVVAYEAPAHGGHCGFIANWRMESWVEGRVLGWIAERLRDG